MSRNVKMISIIRYDYVSLLHGFRANENTSQSYQFKMSCNILINYVFLKLRIVISSDMI